MFTLLRTQDIELDRDTGFYKGTRGAFYVLREERGGD